VVFDGDSEVLPTGAVIPTGFKKTIQFDNKSFSFIFQMKMFRELIGLTS